MKITLQSIDKANNFVNAAEGGIVNLLSAIAPWLAPLAAMQITIKHMIESLDFWVPVAWGVGFVIEVLGLATISTSLAFWKHNKRYTADENRAPIVLAIGAFVVYLLIVLSVVALLEWPWENEKTVSYIHVLVKTELALLSIPAALTLAIRAQFSEIKNDISERYGKTKKAKAKVSEGDEKSADELSEISENQPKETAGDLQYFGKVRKTNLLPEHWHYISQHSASEVAKAFDMSERNAEYWKKEVPKEYK